MIFSKKAIAGFLASALMLTALTGCGQKETSSDGDRALGSVNESGYPVVEKQITLRMFAPKHALHTEYANMVLFQEMEKKTNIKVEWILASTENYPEARALAWNSKDLPDAFFLWNNVDEQIKYAESKLIVPFEDLIDKYMPNYKKAMEKYPEITALTTLPDGHIYSTAIINEVPRDKTFKQYINKNWLDALNLNIPQTVDELYTVLTAFKEKDPNGNGLNDEIPLSTVSMYQTRNFLMSAFGYVSTGVELDGDKTVYVPQTNNYKEYLTYANKLYSAGLMDNSTFIMTAKDLAAKGNQGIVGSFDGAAPYLVVGKQMDQDYVAVSPLTSSISDKKMWLGFDDLWPTGFVITKANKNVAATLRWIDYLYSDEAKPLQSYGMENKNWKWDDSAKSTWSFNYPDNMDPEQYRGTITPAVGLGSIAWLDKEFILKDSTPLVRRINEQVDAAKYMDYLKKPYPQVMFTADENKKLSIIKTDLDTYMKTIEVEFVTGKKALDDKNWQEHLDTLKKMNVDEMIKIYSDAYARYKSK